MLVMIAVIRKLLSPAWLIAVLVLGTLSCTDRHPKSTAFISPHSATVTAPKEHRKIYPLSVIYGGAYSSEELNRSRRLDPVVRAHYADFGKNPVVEQNPKDVFMYISYRKSDKVYWTKTKRRIPKGESLLSDGKNLARTRCGNRLSFAPQQPTLPEKELPEEVLNTPEAPKVSLPFDAPPPPSIEADLYVSPNPLFADFVPPVPTPFAASPNPSADSSGGLAGALTPMPGVGFPGGGTPLFRGNQLSAGSNGVTGLGVSPLTLPIALATPEPAASGLLLASGLFFLLLAFGIRTLSV
jgi:hypothetical protein